MIKTLWWQALLMLLFSASNDWLSIVWHRAREQGEAVKGAFFAFILGLIGWLSIYWVIKSSVWLISADLLGTIIGSYFGIRHDKKRKLNLEAIVSGSLLFRTITKGKHNV